MRYLFVGLPLLVTLGIAEISCNDDGDNTSSCDEQGFSVFLDETTGQYLIEHPETGLRWARCPIGQNWNADSCACEGEPNLLLFSEALAACPTGFVFPSDNDFSTILCNFSTAMISECPAEHYDSCASCSLCNGMFPDDNGYYPSFDYEWDADAGAGGIRGFDFSTGCTSEDYFSDELYGPSWNVRCVEEQ